ncbi:hypothetical protein MRX96_055008 [Rhipicephalus microplus]
MVHNLAACARGGPSVIEFQEPRWGFGCRLFICIPVSFSSRPGRMRAPSACLRAQSEEAVEVVGLKQCTESQQLSLAFADCYACETRITRTSLGGPVVTVLHWLTRQSRFRAH